MKCPFSREIKSFSFPETGEVKQNTTVFWIYLLFARYFERKLPSLNGKKRRTRY
jgi:hypothetical protein